MTSGWTRGWFFRSYKKAYLFNSTKSRQHTKCSQVYPIGWGQIRPRSYLPTRPRVKMNWGLSDSRISSVQGLRRFFTPPSSRAFSYFLRRFSRHHRTLTSFKLHPNAHFQDCFMPYVLCFIQTCCPLNLWLFLLILWPRPVFSCLRYFSYY